MRLFLFLIFQTALFADPEALYLTWQDDPLTTMTIQWITSSEVEQNLVVWREADQKIWKMAEGKSSLLPDNMPYLLHRVLLQGLKPGSDYVFQIEGQSGSYKFRTLPEGKNEQVKFVEGGDVYHDALELVAQTNRQAASKSPHFAIVGGDLAYAGSSNTKPDPSLHHRWIEWLSLWKETMITPEGYLIPIIPAIGNHDINGRYKQTPKDAPFFYTLFPFPGEEGCNILNCGNYLSLIILDSHHSHPIWGRQTAWLYKNLKERAHVDHTFAFYHVPAYPSVRSYNKEISQSIRKYWVPCFEKFHLSAAFEHHDHAYKRTKPILRGKPDSKGVIYLGDGAWGVEKPRKPKKNWYLAVTAKTRNFILVSVQEGIRTFTAFDPDGKVIDHVVQRIE